ncbi:hypothetical protein MASR2M66_29500 [Chloroflexota bacterium]
MAEQTPEEIAIARITEAAKRKATDLSLMNLNLKRLSKQIGELDNLVYLYLSGNSLTELPAEIGLLKNLKVIWLFDNELTRLPPEIGSLVNLQSLYVRNNQLASLPTEIFNLNRLSILDVRNNQIKKLQDEILSLKSLAVLYLGYNEIHNIPSQIKQLSRITNLDISHTYIKTLPPEIKELKKLNTINAVGTSIGVPPEILYEQNAGAILEVYFQGRKPLQEAKIVFIGQGSVGKTSLVERIRWDRFDQNQIKTDGIAINQWEVPDSSPTTLSETVAPKSINLRLWDFGGQEIMHATHQFFLSKRSLYLLVMDSRLSQEENRIEYWLKIIESFSDESPVLIVGNKIDQHPLDIDRTGLQKKYPNIVGILETSAATGAGIEELKTAITEQVNNLPHVRDLLPETWFTVKTKLEELGKQSNFITQEKYLDLCAENEVSDETSQRTLIGFLHDLGVVLHFQDDPRLEALGILNPQWVTNGVYKILNSHTLFQNKGVLTTSMLDEILNLPEYPRGKRLFIVDMMKKFELCYDIEPDKTFLVPDLLPKDQPNLNFNGVSAFEYAYPVLPSSVITRFIVRMNQKIDDGFVWRTGVVLKIGDNKALVKADIEDRKITIAIEGVEHTRRDALLAVCTHLDEIHDSIKGLNPEKLIPVPGAVNAKPLSYNYLLMLEAKGIEVLPVPDGNSLIDVNIRKVLSGVPNEIRPKDSGGNVTHIHIGGNFDGNLTVGDGNQSIKDSYNKITTAKIDPELKQTLQQLVEAVETMTKSLPEEQAIEATEDLGKLVEEATKPKPNKRWYSVSIEGLIKAAENLDKLGTPVISLSRKVLSLLTGGVVK